MDKVTKDELLVLADLFEESGMTLAAAKTRWFFDEHKSRITSLRLLAALFPSKDEEWEAMIAMMHWMLDELTNGPPLRVLVEHHAFLQYALEHIEARRQEDDGTIFNAWDNKAWDIARGMWAWRRTTRMVTDGMFYFQGAALDMASLALSSMLGGMAVDQTPTTAWKRSRRAVAWHTTINWSQYRHGDEDEVEDRLQDFLMKRAWA